MKRKENFIKCEKILLHNRSKEMQNKSQQQEHAEQDDSVRLWKMQRIDTGLSKRMKEMSKLALNLDQNLCAKTP